MNPWDEIPERVKPAIEWWGKAGDIERQSVSIASAIAAKALRDMLTRLATADVNKKAA